tara:strand:- start:7739 stop:8923 length:1185 start_codon:yes stop_codon:yes gene_type:complete
LTRFIHTADWQIGKPFLQIKDEEKRFKLKRERIDVIARIREAARTNESEFILIAGDLFDSPTPSISSITEVLEAIGTMDIPVFVITGNHDHGALGTVWHTDDFNRYQNQMAPNLNLLLDSTPIDTENAIIFPCPLLRNHDSSDPTIWLREIDWNTISSTKTRILLAHGNVNEFSGPDYAFDDEAQSGANNLINLANLPIDEIDYIALGDWHNLKQVKQKVWYSGTPEPDRFDQGENNQRGQVLQVDAYRGKDPIVKPILTGRIKWHNISFKFNIDDDVERLERKINELIDRRVSRDLIRIEISGVLSLAGHNRYKLLINDLENKLLRLRIKGECHQAPEPCELEKLTRNIEDPLIAQVANQLQEQLKREEDKDSELASITRAALCELYRLAMEE